MTMDDDRLYWREHTPPRPMRRLGCGVIAVLAAICVCGGLAASFTGYLTDGSGSVHPVALTAGGVAGTLLAAWGIVAMIRNYRRRWSVYRHGEIVSAVLESKSSVYDGEAGSHQWQMRLSGRTRDGHTFNRGMSAGYKDPGPIGTRVTVRYHPALRRITAVERGVGAAVMWLIAELFILAAFVSLVYLLVAIPYGLVRLWT